MKPFVTIVVPTHRRRELLERLLRSLAAVDYPGDKYEVIVVADTTYDDGTKQAVRSMIGAVPFELRFLETGRKPPAAKRNQAVKQAKGELMGFTDDDCVADPSWIKEAVALFFDPSVAGVHGRTVIPDTDRTDSSYRRASHLAKPGYQTCNIFYRKDVLEEAGGFDERFIESAREDSDLAFTVLKRGHKIEYSPTAIISHPVKQNEPWELIKSAKRALSDPLLFKKHPDLYREHIRTVFSRSYKMFYSFAAIAALLSIIGMQEGAAFFLALYAIVFLASAFKQLKGTCPTSAELGGFLASLLVSPYVLLYSVMAGNIKYRSRLWY